VWGFVFLSDKVLAVDGKEVSGNNAMRIQEILDDGQSMVTLFLAKGEMLSRKVRVVLRRQVRPSHHMGVSLYSRMF
jgi:hypothetical protein